jgi:DNA (cytosine-5)-methyltransferase 1
MRHVAHTTLGEHRGAPRLWLEGWRLNDVGAAPGARFRVLTDAENETLTILIDDKGDRVVSGKDERPIIDMNNGMLGDVFKTSKRLRVTYNDGEIRVEVNPCDKAAAERATILRHKIESKDALDVGSIAFGGGVLDAALHDGMAAEGLDTKLRWAVEIDDRYLDIARANHPSLRSDTITINAPMQEFDPSSLPRVDVLAAGIPCNSMSLSGRAKQRSLAASKDDLAHPEGHEDGALFVAFLRYIERTNPAVVLLENVPPYADSAAYAAIRSVMKGWGYRIEDAIVDGAQFGALEARKRLVSVMTTGDIGFRFENLPVPTFEPKRLADILDPIHSDAPEWRTFEYLAAKELRDQAAGKGFRQQILTPDHQSCGTIGKFYNKGRSTEPRLRHPTNPALSRLFTPGEHARIKTVPERLIAGASATVAHEILGQGVIYEAFRSVGRGIAAALLGRPAGASIAGTVVPAAPAASPTTIQLAVPTGLPLPPPASQQLSLI